MSDWLESSTTWSQWFCLLFVWYSNADVHVIVNINLYTCSIWSHSSCKAFNALNIAEVKTSSGWMVCVCVSWSITTCLEDGRLVFTSVTMSASSVWPRSRWTRDGTSVRRPATASTSSATRPQCCGWPVSIRSAFAVCTAAGLSSCSPSSRSGVSSSSLQPTTNTDLTDLRISRLNPWRPLLPYGYSCKASCARPN